MYQRYRQPVTGAITDQLVDAALHGRRGRPVTGSDDGLIADLEDFALAGQALTTASPIGWHAVASREPDPDVAAVSAGTAARLGAGPRRPDRSFRHPRRPARTAQRYAALHRDRDWRSLTVRHAEVILTGDPAQVWPIVSKVRQSANPTPSGECIG